MEMKKLFGWVFLIAGVTLMISPFSSGLTGYFVLTSSSALATGTNFEITYIIAGFIMAVFGYYLVRPRKETVFS